MKEVYLNGKDVNIFAADFFAGLGADLDTMVYTMVFSSEYTKTLHRIKFTLDGNRYTALWSNFSNRLNIKCDDLEFQDGEIANERLCELNKKITPDMFGDLVVRKIVARPEGDMPELMITFYEK